jgi:alkyldihydroxyacetonephosphate synthase
MREQVFWGWGEPGAGPELPPHAADWLRSELGVSGEVVSRPVGLADVALREPALPAGLRERLEAICAVRDDRELRVLRAAGKSYLDLLAQRAGACEDAPDAVVQPGSADEVRAVLEACAAAEVAVVPFGGGTSVVGGVAPERGGRAAVVSLDLGRMDAVVGVDARSQIARLQPGLRLPEADHALAAHGFTLGHFPQSYEWATVGGCVATRSAGQASTGFGRIEENVVALDLVSPAASVSTREKPMSAAGPLTRELLIGSEGAFGVITEVALRVRPLAHDRRYEGYFLPSFVEGVEVLRSLAQDELAPDVARLSDEEETAVGLALAGRARLGKVLERVRPCLLILGWEGDIEARRGEARRRLLAGPGRALPGGQGAGAAWLRSRYAGPHLRDDLLDRGLLVETLETATTWSRLEALRAAVYRALDGLHVGCHISHVYPTGASLYFTALGVRDGDPAAQWQRYKAAACDAIVEHGGTLTHHHAVGRDHAPWLPREDPGGVELLRALKERLDPAGIMNPGKLLA